MATVLNTETAINRRTIICEKFSFEFALFVCVMRQLITNRDGQGPSERFKDGEFYNALFDNLREAENKLIHPDIVWWLKDICEFYCKRYGDGAESEIMFLTGELRNFNRTLAGSIEYQSPQMVVLQAHAENVEDSSEDAANQAKNIKESIEMMLEDAKKIPGLGRLVRKVSGKKDKKRGKAVSTGTRYFNEMLKFVGAN